MKNKSGDYSLIQTARNIMVNIISFAIDIIVSLWYTPYLIRQLGKELYGIIPLANSVISYFSMIPSSLDVGGGRNLTLNLENGKGDQVEKIFNTNLIIIFLIVSALLPFGILLVWAAPYLFELPEKNILEAQILFLIIFGVFQITTLKTGLSVASYARNRFDLRRIFIIISRLSQIGIIIFLFQLYEPDLIIVGIGAFLAAVINFAGDIYLWRILLPELKVRLKIFNRGVLKALLKMSAWSFLFFAGKMLLWNVDMIVANRFLSLELAGMYGALISIPKNLRIIADSVGGVWGPSILRRFGQNDLNGMNRLMDLSIRITGLTLALPIGLISGIAAPLLALWLGRDFSELSNVLVVLSFPLATNLIIGPYFSAFVSMNKIKVPAIFSILAGILNLILSIIFVKKFGMIGIPVANLISMTLYYSIFSPIYSAKVLGFKASRFISLTLQILFITVFVAASSYGLSVLIPIESLIAFLVVCSIISAAYLLIAFFLFFKPEDRKMLLSKFKPGT